MDNKNSSSNQQYQDILDQYAKDIKAGKPQEESPKEEPTLALNGNVEPELKLEATVPTPISEPKIDPVFKLPIEETPILPMSENSDSQILPPISDVVPISDPIQAPESNRTDNLDIPPIETIPSTPPISIEKPKNNIFKVLFFISLFIFLCVVGAIVYVLLNNNNQPSSQTENPATPTPEIIATPTAAEFACTLNDNKYEAGESFPSADGCNTCSCDINGNIACTEKACAATSSSTKTATPSSQKVLKISDIQMTLPSGWTVTSVVKNTAKILTDYKKYKVSLILNLDKDNAAAESAYRSKSSVTKIQGGEVFNVAGGGSIGLTGALLNDKKYLFTWDIESNQPVPKDLDQVWVPDNNVTSEILMTITKSIKPIN